MSTLWSVTNRALVAVLVSGAVAVALAACGDDNGSGGASYGDSCNAYTTCGSCTPVNGCGWCFDTAGGLCASTPDECTNVTEFTWTWDPSGCPDVDASVVPLDAGKGGG